MNSIWRPKGNGARRRRDREKSVSQEFRPLGGNYCLIAYECDAISWVSSWKKRKTDRETEKGGEETQSFGNRRRRYNEGARIGSAARLSLFPPFPPFPWIDRFKGILEGPGIFSFEERATWAFRQFLKRVRVTSVMRANTSAHDCADLPFDVRRVVTVVMLHKYSKGWILPD